MQQLAVLNSAAAAQTFADYCLTQGWSVSVVVHSAEHAEIFCEAADEPQVAAELQQFLQQPGHDKYSAAAWQRSQPLQHTGSSGLGALGQGFLQQTGPVVWLLTIPALLVFVCLQIWPQQVFDSLRFFSADAPELLSYRWWSPVLLHFSAAHLMFNLLALWIYGGRLEVWLGSRQLLLLALVAGFVSNLSQFLLTGPNFGGLSGVVYAIFGFVWVYGWRYPQQPLQLSKPDLVLALGFLGLGFADLLWVNTANWAHLSGFVCGMALATLARSPVRQPG
ncbi:MAG: rhomboid family intramembrane serine protease [Rheinheimera sp.]|nr:MAG: rhomboid family intramembrane serine protease [Rheinheimera sp.]